MANHSCHPHHDYNKMIHNYMYAAYAEHIKRKNCKSKTTLCGPLNANGYRIYGLPEPIEDNEAATKSYVDNKSSGDSGTITVVQINTVPQKITHITYSHIMQTLPKVLFTLTALDAIHDRLTTYYLQNVNLTGFEIVTNMKYNTDRFVAQLHKFDYESNHILPAQLLSIDGNPAGLITYANPDQPDELSPMLLRSNDTTGDSGMSDITPGTPLGANLGIVGGNPASVYMINNGLVYTRCSVADGTGTWIETPVPLPVGVMPYKPYSPMELNGGVYFVLRSTNAIYSVTNDKATGDGPWIVRPVYIPPSLSLEESISTAVMGVFPAFTYTNNRKSVV